MIEHGMGNVMNAEEDTRIDSGNFHSAEVNFIKYSSI